MMMDLKRQYKLHDEIESFGNSEDKLWQIIK